MQKNDFTIEKIFFMTITSTEATQADLGYIYIYLTSFESKLLWLSKLIRSVNISLAFMATYTVLEFEWEYQH